MSFKEKEPVEKKCVGNEYMVRKSLDMKLNLTQQFTILPGTCRRNPIMRNYGWTEIPNISVVSKNTDRIHSLKLELSVV